MNKVVIGQPRAYPHITYLHKLVNADTFIISDDLVVNKTALEIRNKYKCVLSDKAQYLNIPVEGKEPFNRLEIREQFARKHRKILHDNYKKYPHYDPWILDLTIPAEGRHGWFGWWKIHTIALCNLLDININFKSASRVNTQKKKTDRLVDILDHYQATEYLSGMGGRNYLELDKIKIPVSYHDTTNPMFKYRKDDDNMYMIYDTIFTLGLEETIKILHS